MVGSGHVTTSKILQPFCRQAHQNDGMGRRCMGLCEPDRELDCDPSSYGPEPGGLVAGDSDAGRTAQDRAAQSPIAIAIRSFNVNSAKAFLPVAVIALA